MDGAQLQSPIVGKTFIPCRGRGVVTDSDRKGSSMSISVEVKDDIEKAIKLLKKKMQLEGLQKELKHRRFYQKPSVKKKRKRLEASRRRRRSGRRFHQ
jgi:small subunit ribosomal protein S21